MGNCCVMGTEFQFCMMKKFWQLNIPNPTDMVKTLKMVKIVNFILSIFYHNKNKETEEKI